MAKGPHLTKQVKILIAQIHLKHPAWGATKLRESLLQELKSLGLDQFFGPDWPSVSAVHKELTETRRRHEKIKELGQEEPWSMATLDEHPIPPEALPAVLEVWKLRIEQGATFTIREAKWAGRLSVVLTKGAWTLSAWSYEYARTELYYQLAGRPFNSAGLDSLLMGLPLTGDLDYFPVLAAEGDNLEQRIQDLTKQGQKKGGSK